MQNIPIGVSNLPNLVHNEFTHMGCNFNIMIVGSHGLGKTTFINKLLEQNIVKKAPFEDTPDSGNPYCVLEAKCNIQTSYIEIRENAFTIRLNITEIDGIGDSVDNRECYRPIIDLIEANFNDYHQKFKEQTKSTIDDKRIHVCLYFLEPIGTIKTPDLETLKHISTHCTIIPIIAKADLLSKDELHEMKDIMRDILNTNGIAFFDPAEPPLNSPFAIFCDSRSPDDNAHLDWAQISFNSQTNDFLLVKRLIIERNALFLITKTDQYYDNYRISHLLTTSSDADILARKERIENKIREYNEKINSMHCHTAKNTLANDVSVEIE